ncbi:MAG: gltT [Chlamydiia bacterium]|nr:gltT [Chlamydiia bacterium]
MKLWAKILIAIALGVITGFILGPTAALLKPIGTLFLNALNMLIVPLVFSSIILGITSTPDTKKLGRVGGLTLLLYTVTTLIALVLGISVSSWLQLGKELHLTTATAIVAKELPSIAELFIGFVPRNPITAFAEGNILQIIVFGTLFGYCLNYIGEKAKPLIQCFDAIANAMFHMTSLVMKISPYGVFALMAWATGSFGLEVLLPVFKFLLSYYAACIAFAIVVFGGMLFFMAKLSPLPFFKGMTEAIATAASTCSSSASLPANIQCATENLGISKSLANFVLPLGCTLNMNGSALFQAMSALFIAQAYGIELSFQHLIIMSATVVLATLGTASIPGAGLIMLSIVFNSLGIPLEGLAILASIDRLRDMATTTLNITGDAVCAVYVAKREGELNEELYYSQVKESQVEQTVTISSQTQA